MEKEHQASLRYTIAQLCEQMESQANVSFDKFYVSALTQIAYDFILTCFGPDLFYAAQFRNGQLNSISPPSLSTGKKKKSSAVTVEAHDVLFQSRRNQVLNDHLVQILTRLLKDNHRHKRTKKGQNQKSTHRHHHTNDHDENEDYEEKEDDNLEAYDEFSVGDEDDEEQVQQEHVHVDNDENDDYCDIDLRSVVVSRNRDSNKIQKRVKQTDKST